MINCTSGGDLMHKLLYTYSALLMHAVSASCHTLFDKVGRLGLSHCSSAAV